MARLWPPTANAKHSKHTNTHAKKRIKKYQPPTPPKQNSMAERVPYVVVYGEPGARLVDLCVDPRALVASDGRLRVNGLYYITKQVRITVSCCITVSTVICMRM